MRTTSLLLLFLIVLVTTKWTQIKLDPVVWEELPQRENGTRVLSCSNYELETKNRYRWRFNGSSILPKQTKVQRDELLFNTSLDAYRDLFAGEYTCCIQESLGKACYTQQLQIRDRPKQFGVDLSDADILYANTGNSYDIRLSSGSEHTEVLCLLNNQTILSNVLHLSHKNKRGKYYHIRIKHFSKENVGEYDCTLRRDGKDVLMKTFVATLESEPAVSFSTNLGCFVLLLLTVVHD